MKKLLLSFFILFSISSFSQEDAWIYFNEKPNSEAYFSNPLTMLSQRALDRRTSQNIPLDDKDIPISEDFIAQVESANGITVKAKSKWLNVVHVRGSAENIQSLSQLSFVSNVVFANKNLNPVTQGKSMASNNSSRSNKTKDSQINYNYGNSNNQIEMLNGNLLHQQNFTGSGKIIAVLDAGFPGVNTAQPFAQLFANSKILGGYNYVGRNNDIYSANNHGTLVLSTMGGYTENQLVGTAPDASYYLFITEDSTSENPIEESLWVEAAEAADSLGVDIINTSLGYFTYDNPNYSHTYENMNGTTTFIARGADIAASRGMVVVVSAGNSGSTANPYISTPADAVNVLTVGAVTATSEYASFSSIGPSFDGRVKPDVMAQGQNAVIANTSGDILTANGTSFSAPITAGMVACLWQALPAKTSKEIIRLIKESAHLYENPNAQFGYGIPNFYEALQAGLGIKDFPKEDFLVFPNPVESELLVMYPVDIKYAEILIYNSLGQFVVRKDLLQGNKISVNNLSSGIYFYQIYTSKKTITGKLIKK